MSQRKKIRYRAIWQQAGQPESANIDFDTVSDHHAKKVADGLARQLGVTNTPRTIIRRDNHKTIEMINKGVSD